MPYNTSGVKLAAPVMPHCVARLSVEAVDVGMTGGDEPKKRFLVQLRVVEPPPELADYTGHTFSTNYVVGMVLRNKEDGELLTDEGGNALCNDPDANESETWEHPKNFAARRWWGLMAGCGAAPTGDEQADADAVAGSEFMGEVRVNPSRTDANGNTYDPRNDLGQVFAPGDRNAELKVIKDKGARGARPAQRPQQAPQRSANGPAPQQARPAAPTGPSFKCVQCGKVVAESMRQQHVIAHKKAAQTSAQAPAPVVRPGPQVVTPGKPTATGARPAASTVKRNPAPPPPPEEAMEEAMDESEEILD